MPAAAAAGGSSVSGGPAGRHSGAAGEASSGCPAPALAAPLHHTSLIVPHIRQESFWCVLVGTSLLGWCEPGPCQPHLPSADLHSKFTADHLPPMPRLHRDCGLACCLMVLRALGAPPHRFSMPILQALCPTRSVWSIDIAHLLRACGARVTLATITLGANVAYVTERFYAESMVEDEARVTRLFAVRLKGRCIAGVCVMACSPSPGGRQGMTHQCCRHCGMLCRRRPLQAWDCSSAHCHWKSWRHWWLQGGTSLLHWWTSASWRKVA